MPNPTELAQLKSEVAELRAQVKLLNSFVDIERADPARGTPLKVHIRCTVLNLMDADKNIQASFRATKDGPSLTLRDTEDHTRVRLSVQKQAVQLELLDAEEQVAAELAVEEKTGRGLVLVSESGHPRAGLKVGPTGGVVSVTHDDGHMRMAMISELDGAQLLGVNGDMKPTVKIASSSPHGAFMTVNQPNGKPGLMLACTDQSGAVIIKNRRGKMIASLPSTKRYEGEE